MPQNEMLVVEEIKEANTFGVSADTTPDLSKRDQMATVFRYVNANGDAKKRFCSLSVYFSFKFLACTGHHQKDIILF